jgi:hypothetical protein
MATTLTKINPDCLNIELIDSNICLSDSLPIINSNVENLSSGLNDLNRDIQSWDNTLSLFYANSASMITTMLNIKSINDAYASPYTTVKLLSSQWSSKQFSVYYPTMYELTAFVNSESTYLSEVLSWLNFNFPVNSFAEGQVINIHISLYYISNFVFSFQGNYQENCSPTQHSDATISCNGCGGDNRSAGCNHDVGGRRVCDNPYSYCNSRTTQDSETYTCKGNIVSTRTWTTLNSPNNTSQPVISPSAGNLNINYKQNGEDRFTARVVSYTYKKQNSNWSIQI